MMKCLKITLSGDFPANFLRDTIQKHARHLSLEGTAQQMSDGLIRIFICGNKDDVDAFLDVLHKGMSKGTPETVEVEAFVKDKDFRNVFRVLE